MKQVMKQVMQKVMKNVIAGMLVVVAIVGVSALTIHTPSQNSAARSLNSIQTDKATLFYAGAVPMGCYFVEQVLPNTSESRAATENLKLVAATL
jgi:hypothetical protein